MKIDNTIKGVNIPYKDQNDMINVIKQVILNIVDAGIKLGQYISHGMVTLATTGSQNIRYSIIVRLVKKDIMATVK